MPFCMPYVNNVNYCSLIPLTCPLGWMGKRQCHVRIIILAYRIRISASYTGASKSYLTYPYPSRGKDKNREFHVVCIGRHSTPSLRLTSLYLITSLNVTILSTQYGRRLQSKWLRYQKPAFRNERYARKRIHHGCEGHIEKSVPWDH